ncbi:het domain protein [Stagonosporopsis vannaccii]|nr:het domain protein [Stagonosporopsis vannaccii]
MRLEKPENVQHEHMPSGSDGLPGSNTLTSIKRGVAAWEKSMCLCTALLSTQISFRRRSLYRHSNGYSQHSHRSNIKAQFSPIPRQCIPQVSIVTASTNDSVAPIPGELIDSTKTERTSATPSYTPELYRAMPHENSIRLLCIHKGFPSDRVEITLKLARLDHPTPTYEALSYVWGSGVQVSHIIDETTKTPIPVTGNLYNALKGVRKFEQDRIVWVDALCINQSDGKEKSIQVRKMNSIYTHAARVIVWLGDDEAGDADGAIAMLDSLANPEGERTQYEARSRDSIPFMPSQDFDIRDSKAWRKVMIFFCNTWFTRLWVLQEIVLAQDAIFVWGDCSISWAYVGAAINSIRKIDLIRGLLQTRNLQNAFLMWHMSSVAHHTRTFNDNRQSHQPGIFPFLHLLDIARGFEVTDPRDKIYGLLGFPTRCDYLGASSVLPDYSLSVAQVYTNVTLSSITKTRNLDILALVVPNHPQNTDCIDTLPSWVPDFNSQATAAPISNINTAQKYTAGIFRPLHLLPCTKPHLLCLEGTVLDTIRRTGPSISFVQSLKSQQNLESLIHWYTDAGATVHSLSEILTGGRDREGLLLSPHQKEACVAFLSRTIQNYGLDASTKHVAPAHHDNLKWRDTIHRFTTYRQPFLTCTGRFGLGPTSLSEGDTVAVLWGGQCPFVLSGVDDRQWLLRGECYVQGWMDGEGVAELVLTTGREGVKFEFI